MHTRKLLLSFSIVIGYHSVCAQPGTDSIPARRVRIAWPEGNSKQTRQLVTSIGEDGSWNEINYKDRQKGGWKPLDHVTRLRTMAIAWAAPASPLYHNKEVWNACSKAIDHWLQHRYQSANWWYNEIGVPRMVLDFIALARHQLNARQREGALQLLGQHRVNGTGANLVWSADLALHNGTLTGDTAMIRRNSDLIIASITIGEPEGIQQGYSFYQHKERLQSFHYGSSFLQNSLFLASELYETPWAFNTGTNIRCKNHVLKADRPCLVLLKNDILHASDPRHLGGPLQLTIAERAYNIILPTDGTAVQQPIKS